MPLVTTIRINEDVIAKVAAERIETDDTTGWHTYQWTVERTADPRTVFGLDKRKSVTGKLEHFYKEGALKLLSQVLAAYYREVAEYEFEHKHENNGY